MSKSLPPGLDRLKNGRIRARYVDGDGHRHSAVFDGSREAQAWQRAQRVAVDNGSHVSVAAGRVTFREWAEAWRLAQVHRPTSAEHVESTLRRHIYPRLGDRPIAGIRPSDVQALVKDISQTLAPSTVHVAHGVMSAVFKSAVEDRRIAANPCAGTRLPKIHRAPVVPLTTDQVLGLAEAMPQHLRAPVILAAGTGMRFGEVVGLTLDRIDWPRRTLSVDRQLVTVSGRAPYLGPPKTRTSTRSLPLADPVLVALGEHVRLFPQEPMNIDTMTAGGRVGSERVTLMFGTPRGKPWRRSTFGDAWRPARDKATKCSACRAASAKVCPHPAAVPADTGFHDLRHHLASVLIEHGASVKTVQTLLGHATASETLDTYSHLWPGAEDAARDAVAAVFGGKVVMDWSQEAL